MTILDQELVIINIARTIARNNDCTPIWYCQGISACFLFRYPTRTLTEVLSRQPHLFDSLRISVCNKGITHLSTVPARYQQIKVWHLQILAGKYWCSHKSKAFFFALLCMLMHVLWGRFSCCVLCRLYTSAEISSSLLMDCSNFRTWGCCLPDATLLIILRRFRLWGNMLNILEPHVSLGAQSLIWPTIELMW